MQARSENLVAPATSAGDDVKSGDGNSGVAGESRFQKAILAWRDIDLSNQITQLDKIATEIITEQQSVLVKRKDLAQETKDFRRMDEAGKLSKIKALLKSYQSYIDDVSNQSKVIQNAFLQLYTPLSEAPDPYPLLEASVDSLMMVEDNLPRLQKENEWLQTSVTRLTSKLEEKDRQLETERKCRSSGQETQMNAVKQIEDTWETVLREKENSWNIERKTLVEKSNNQEQLIKKLRASQEVAQRIAQGESHMGEDGPSATAAAAELEILSSELERTNIRVVDLEKRNEQLMLQLTQSASNLTSSAKVEESTSYIRLQNENQALLDRVESMKETRDRERSKNQHELKTSTRELDAARRDRDDFRSKLQRWKDYDVIKQELEILKRVGFNLSDDDQDEKGDGDGNSEERLEKLLIDRNQKLSSEMTEMRVAQLALEEKLAENEKKAESLSIELEKAQKLNQTLESDLEKIQLEMETSYSGPTRSVVGTSAARSVHSSWKKRAGNGRLSPTSSIISGWGPSPSEFGAPIPDHTADSSVAGPRNAGWASTSSSAGILPMITAQRDRFKKQSADLEAEVQRNQSSIRSLRSELDALKKDNMQLYEKNRYLTAAGSIKPAASPPNSHVVNMSSSGHSLDRYRKAYESHLSPFAAFRANEHNRGMRRLSLPERLLLGAVKYVVRDRLMCNIFAIYFIVIHIYLLGTLLLKSPPVTTAAVVARRLVRR